MLSKERIYKELHRTINMTQAEFRAWLLTDLAPITVANYPDAPSMDKSKKLLQIIGKDKDELSSSRLPVCTGNSAPHQLSKKGKI